MNWRDQNVRLSHLEAEAIHTMREAVAEFRNPVMLFSIGKDSCVMVHIAQKAFASAKPPFPLLHIDTTWKFGEMISFRDEMATRLGRLFLPCPPAGMIRHAGQAPTGVTTRRLPRPLW